ncbi:MAG: type II secretion system F family protein [Candidatus Levyibacteriota bacterium]
MKTKNISISTPDKLGMISNLATMLAAGISILETVDSLLEDSKGNQRKILEELRSDLTQGNHISASFAKFPRVFDNVTVNLIKAAEEAGTLDVTLKDLKDTIKRDAEFKDKIRSAMIYPSLIMVVFLGVLIMILYVVVPKISTVFLKLNANLPLPTKILIFLSQILTTQTPLAIGVSVAFIGGIVFLYKRNRGLFLNVLFSLPLVTQLVKEIDLARFSRSMYLLLNAGIPITSALDLGQEVVLKKEVRQAILKGKEMVTAGNKFSEGLKNAKHIFPSIMVKIIEAGEKSGSLDKSMLDVSDYLDYKVQNTLGLLVTIIEPLMLLVVGVMVGGMMLSIIAPIYGLIGSVGAH